MLDQVVQAIDNIDAKRPVIAQESALSSDAENSSIRVAIIGQPNVGKSSLLNTLVGSERALVSPIAGTTHDPVDTQIELLNRKVTLIDTAGAFCVELLLINIDLCVQACDGDRHLNRRR